MPFSSRFLLALCASSMAAVPFQFTSGSAAKAEEVNKNFNFLDSAKASKSSVDILASAIVAKIDASEATTKLGAKVDTGTYGKYVRDQVTRSVVDTGLTRRVTTVESAVANKLDKGTITPASIHAIADSLGMSKSSLTVNGSLIATGGINATSIVKSTGGTSGEPAFRLVRDNAPVDAKGWDWTSDQAGGSLFLRTINDAQNNSAWAMKIDRAGTTPTAISLYAPVFVNGGISASKVLAGTTTSTTGAPATFVNSNPNLGLGWNEGPEILPAVNGNAGLFFRSNTSNIDSTIILSRGPDGYFRIGFKGLTGMVGTSDPSAPFEISPSGVTKLGSTLSVKGNITAQSANISDLRVAGSLITKPTEPWADYVFEHGYKAMALKDVETFAKANGHLPEVPSAAEVVKDGIDLARMNAILLKKIEELTLHAVAQEKRMEALSAKVEALQAERK
jgi:hypothetical protein